MADDCRGVSHLKRHTCTCGKAWAHHLLPENEANLNSQCHCPAISKYKIQANLNKINSFRRSSPSGRYVCIGFQDQALYLQMRFQQRKVCWQ